MSNVDNRPALFPVGTQPMPGDTVRQRPVLPIVGRVSADVPAQVDQKTMKVQFLVEWEEVGEDGTTHVASTWFEAGDVEIVDRPPEVPAE